MFERLKWPAGALALGALGALLRRWQLHTALDAESGLFAPFAPASLALGAYLAAALALLPLLAARTREGRRQSGRLCRWEVLFAAGGNAVYLGLAVFGALLTLGAAPLLLGEAMEARAARAASDSVGALASNGILEILLAVCAAAACAAMLSAAQNNYRMRGRGRENAALLLPVLLCCLWLLKSYRSNAPDPALWSYVPLLLAIGLFTLFHMECAALSFADGKPRRLLWLGAAAIVMGGVAMVGSAAGTGGKLLLGGQAAAALAALWVVPGNLLCPPGADRFGLRAQLRQGRETPEEAPEQTGQEQESEADRAVQEEEEHD